MSPLSVRVGFPAFTLAEYEQVMAALNFPDEWPDGLIVHGAYEVDGQLRATSVWESREAWQRYREERLLPAMARTLGSRNEAPNELVRELHVFYSRERVPT